MEFATWAIHADAGIEVDSDLGPPIHVTTTFKAGDPDGFVYSRNDQPTRRRLERVLGKLEGGSAVFYPSGQAASFAALLHFRPRRIAIDRGYFGTHHLLHRLTGDLKIVDIREGFERGDLVWLETPKNPMVDIEDIAEYAVRAHRADAIVLVDSTLATPVLQNPLRLGADVVMHSSTKFIAGHSDALGGVLVVADGERAERLRQEREDYGLVPGALETWLTLRSVRTLELRVRRQSESAAEICRWLSNHVDRVWHPSLLEAEGNDVYRRQMSGGGGLLCFAIGDAEKAMRLPSKLRLFRDATSLGGVESLLEWRHKHDKEISPKILRASIGLEWPSDLIADLEQGLMAVDAWR